MSGEPGIVGVGAATPVATVEPVATRTGELPAALASALPLPAAAAGVRTEISNAARLLSVLLNHPSLAGAAAAPAAPLLASADPRAASIGNALRSGIGLSGLFYESHQAEWVAGTRDLEVLKQEPQSRMTPEPERQAATLPAIVKQQLEMLDGQPLHWRGELWPGLPLQLQITRDTLTSEDSSPRHDASDDEVAWQSQLTSTLPALGRISARLRIAGERLSIELASAEPDSAARIAAEAATLSRSLQAAGLRLQSFTSRPDDSA